MLPCFLSEKPRSVIIGNSCLKPFHAAAIHALVASTQPPILQSRQQGIEKLTQLQMCLHQHILGLNSNCHLGNFHPWGDSVITSR